MGRSTVPEGGLIANDLAGRVSRAGEGSLLATWSQFNSIALSEVWIVSQDRTGKKLPEFQQAGPVVVVAVVVVVVAAAVGDIPSTRGWST